MQSTLASTYRPGSEFPRNPSYHRLLAAFPMQQADSTKLSVPLGSLNGILSRINSHQGLHFDTVALTPLATTRGRCEFHHSPSYCFASLFKSFPPFFSARRCLQVSVKFSTSIQSFRGALIWISARNVGKSPIWFRSQDKILKSPSTPNYLIRCAGRADKGVSFANWCVRKSPLEEDPVREMRGKTNVMSRDWKRAL